jgi:hypothetical protein
VNARSDSAFGLLLLHFAPTTTSDSLALAALAADTYVIEPSIFNAK